MPGKKVDDGWLKPEGGENLSKKPAKQKAPVKKKVEIKKLTLLCNVWNEKLNKTYSVGKYTPETEEEYKALLPYSLEGK